MIIGLCGAQGSGKDTVANILISEYGFVKLTFASTLKDVVAILFSWPRDLLEGLTEESRLWRETVDDFWSSKLSIPSFTPRKALQMIGTDLFRIHFNNDIWISIVENKIGAMLKNNPNINIVISDCRFANEINVIKKVGGITLRVERGDRPGWHTSAVRYNTAPTNSEEWIRAKSVLDSIGVHASEYSSVGLAYDHYIDNNGHIDQLHSQIQSLVNL